MFTPPMFSDVESGMVRQAPSRYQFQAAFLGHPVVCARLLIQDVSAPVFQIGFLFERQGFWNSAGA
jgi:hypothetical protein